MAYCRLEDTFVDDPKWDAIAAVSGLCRATVAGHVAFLYSWCLRHAPDGHLGDLPKVAIMRVVGTTSETLIDALFLHGVLDTTNDGTEVHGYRRRAESYNRAKQKRKERKSKTRRTTVGDASHDSRENVAHREERRGEEINTTPTPSKRKRALNDDETIAVVKHHRKQLQDHRSLIPSTIISKGSIATAKKIRAHWPDDWRGVVDMFVALDDAWLKQHDWPLSVLVKQADRYDAMWKKRGTSPASSAERTVREDAEYAEMLERRRLEAEGQS